MKKHFFPKAGPIGLLLSVAVVAGLAGCVRYVDRPHSRNVYVEPAPVFAEQEEYVYYPGYQMYYGSHSHRYYYQDGPTWVARPVPRGVSVGVLFASPSVTLDFHDGPAKHHAEVSRRYPKTWKPSGGNRGRHEGPGEEKR